VLFTIPKQQCNIRLAGEMSMIRSSVMLTILSGLLLVSSCANPATDTPKASTSPAGPEKSHVAITIDTGSVTTDTPDLTKHLKTADFFDVAKYPQATFESTEIKAGGEKGATHTVTGNLQLHGVTKSVTFPATIVVSPGSITVDSSFAINRKDFGINYAGAADNLIRNEVVLTLHVRGVK
jgi:polyisoprenoid-binding protein YceI